MEWTRSPTGSGVRLECGQLYLEQAADAFLPTLVASLERQGHLHLTDACRYHLLSMSAAIADRLLRSQRGRGLHGLSTTKAGTLLKQQEQWQEYRPGFLEADVVRVVKEMFSGPSPSLMLPRDERNASPCAPSVQNPSCPPCSRRERVFRLRFWFTRTLREKSGKIEGLLVNSPKERISHKSQYVDRLIVDAFFPF